MPTTAHVRQLPPGTVNEAEPIPEVRDQDTFQLFDPPKAIRSLNSPPAYRDMRLVVITAQATVAGSEDTLFEALVGDPDADGNLVFVDILEGDGVYPADSTEAVEWVLYPPLDIHRGLTRRATNTTQVGPGLLGFVVRFLYS